MRLSQILSSLILTVAMLLTMVPMVHADHKTTTQAGNNNPTNNPGGVQTDRNGHPVTRPVSRPVYWNGRIYPSGTYIVKDKSGNVTYAYSDRTSPAQPSQNDNCIGIC